MSYVEFHVSGLSGVVAASLAADSVLFHFRVPATGTAAVRLKRLRALWRTIAGYTAAQEVSLGAYQVTAFGAVPADYTGGTSLGGTIRTIGPDTAVKPRRASALADGNISICTTAGLVHAGTPTVASQPFAFEGGSELATGAAIARGGLDLEWQPSAEAAADRKGLVFIPGHGFVLRNPIALGAGGTGRLFVEAYFEEA